MKHAKDIKRIIIAVAAAAFSLIGLTGCGTAQKEAGNANNTDFNASNAITEDEDVPESRRYY